MQKNRNTKPKNVSYGKVPEDLWKQIEKHFPIYNYRTGRPRADNRAVLNAIWVILWSGSQWKAIERHWFGVSSSVIHERFQTWGRQGIFEEILKTILRFYHRQYRIHWKWQSIDSKSVSSPLEAQIRGSGYLSGLLPYFQRQVSQKAHSFSHSHTGKNPTDRAKLGSKIHILVDQHGSPLSVFVTGANENDNMVCRSSGLVHFA